MTSKTKNLLMDIMEIHDALLARQPEGANHDSETCSLCAANQLETASTAGGAMSDKTFNEVEVQALIDRAVADRVAEVSRELDALRDSQTAADIQSRIDAVTAESEAKVAELQAALDTAVLEAEAAKTERDAMVAWLDEAKATTEREAEVAARKTDRLEKVAAVATFPSDYVQANAERWAVMDDETFESILADYAAVAAKSDTSKETKLPRETAMHVERVETATGVASAAKSVFALRRQGYDTRTV